MIVGHETEELADKRQSFENVIQQLGRKMKLILLLSRKPLLIVKFKTSVYVQIRTRMARLWCSEKGITMRIMDMKSRWCHRHELLALSKIIVAIVIDGLTDRCEPRNTRQPIISPVIDVLLTDIILQIFDCLLGVGKETVANFKICTLAEQERIPRHSMQITLFTNQAIGN